MNGLMISLTTYALTIGMSLGVAGLIWLLPRMLSRLTRQDTGSTPAPAATPAEALDEIAAALATAYALRQATIRE